MPCLEIQMPKVSMQTKEALAEGLTSDFVEAAGFDAEKFGIYFEEYDYGAIAFNGKLTTATSGRPLLHFVLNCPRLKKSVKSQLVQRFTQTFIKCVRNEDWKPVIHINEHPYDNVGVQGKLLSEQFDDLAKAKFYYELPED